MLNFRTMRTLTLSGPALPLQSTGEPALLLESIRGEEALSEIYAYELFALTPLDSTMSMEKSANLDLLVMLGKELTVTIQLDRMGTLRAGLSGRANIGTGEREISGIVTNAAFAGQLDRQCRYRITLEPWLALTKKRSDYRIFQHKSVVEIIDDVLHAYSYSWDKRLSAQYPELVYQVQYGETDFAFIQRLMEENGIYWGLGQG
jgi:type VI secretion system secreted protein VgrG